MDIIKDDINKKVKTNKYEHNMNYKRLNLWWWLIWGVFLVNN